MSPSANSLAHVTNSFTFTVEAPFPVAATLFGPESERQWAGSDWNPRLLFPRPGRDVEGAVFTLDRHGQQSVWVNTRFDLKKGRFQYVYFIAGVLVTTIDVRLSHAGAASTHVAVTYMRTALQSRTNGQVRTLGKKDRESGDHWQRAINAHLKSRR